MKTSYIESGFQNYKKKVIPVSASKIQIEETRNSFYAGAWHLLHTMLNYAVSPAGEPTDADLKLLDDIRAEFDAFVQSKRG